MARPEEGFFHALKERVIEAAFAEYKKPARRALEWGTTIDAQGEATSGFFIQSRKVHFIPPGGVSINEVDATGKNTGKSLGLRDLSAAEWFVASGLQEKAFAILDNEHYLREAREKYEQRLARELAGVDFIRLPAPVMAEQHVQGR